MPEVDPAKSIVVVPPVSYSSLALSKEERVEKGLGFLEKAKMLKRSASEPRVGVEVAVEKSAVGYSRYTDYFKDREHVKYDPDKK